MATIRAQKPARKEVHGKERAPSSRRRDGAVSAMLGHVRRAATASVNRCLLHGPIDGIANVIIARGRLTAFFLVDQYCLGVKDIALMEMGTKELDIIAMTMALQAPIRPIEPAYARKLVRDAAAWASTIGFAPHPDYATAEQIFGDVDADACRETFAFGREGKPLYIPGPTESRAQVRQRLAHLHAHLGEDGFDYAGP